MSSILNSIKKTIKKHVTPKQYEIDEEVDRRLAAKKERREAKKAEDKRSKEIIADLERRLRALEIPTLPDAPPSRRPITYRKRGGKRTRKNIKSRKHRKSRKSL